MNNKQKHIVALYNQIGYKLTRPVPTVPNALRMRRQDGDVVFINHEGISFKPKGM